MVEDAELPEDLESSLLSTLNSSSASDSSGAIDSMNEIMKQYANMVDSEKSDSI